MSLVFAAITPHPPIIIPTIGKENIGQLKATIDGFKKLEEQLYSSKVETILIISPHGLVQSHAFSMNLSPEFLLEFTEFGDFATKHTMAGDVGLAHRMREALETAAPVQLISQPRLDYGSSVPLFVLAKSMPHIKIIPLYYSGLSLEEHFKFGQQLKSEILYSQNRIAVIASGDLSHKLSQNAPGGYSPKAAKFDQKIIDILIQKQSDEILRLSEQQITEACECGLKSIVTLLGILDGINYEPQRISYESPFGVGYLVMNFRL